MKKFILSLTLSLILLFCPGCSSERININSETKNQCAQLLDYLGSNDSDSLKELFCETVSSRADFDDQLLEALEFFDGKVVSYDIKATGANERIADGRQSEVHISPYIGDVITDTNKTYSIKYYSYLVNIEAPEHRGISEMSIESDDGRKFVLGDYETVHNDE